MKNQKKLRCGFTTGTCAAAAAAAAAAKLLLGADRERIAVQMPNGKTADLFVHSVSASCSFAEYMVRKDSGDDPDVTNRAEIHARVEKLSESTGDRIRESALFLCRENPMLFLDGGTGIGRVTKPGLEQHIGQAAINLVPRRMIFAAVNEVYEQSGYDGRLLITVSVPNGELLAVRTFNPRLGIEGGISILGTSGIIEPMSERAVLDTIEAQIRQLSIQGERNLLVTPGNYGQAYASNELRLDSSKSIKCSNYIGETLDLAVSYGMENFLLIGNIGKLVKLAAGIMNTHSKTADARAEIFALHAVLCGGGKEMAEALMSCINTEEMLNVLEKWGLRDAVLGSICVKIEEHMRRRAGGKMRAGAILFSETYGCLGATRTAEEILKEYREEK